MLDAILDRLADEDDLSKVDFPAILREEILALDKQYIVVAKETADFSGNYVTEMHTCYFTHCTIPMSAQVLYIVVKLYFK